MPHPDAPETQYNMSNEDFDEEDEDLSETERSVLQESKSKKKKKKKKVSIFYCNRLLYVLSICTFRRLRPM